MSVAQVSPVKHVASKLALTGAALGLVLGGVVVQRRRARSTPRPPIDEPTSTTAASTGDASIEEDAAPSAAARRAAREGRPMNVVLITIDTLRWDLGYMGYPRAITPNLDALAERAVVFERAYATASYTPKSVGPLLIGRYASETYRDREHYTTFYPANVFVAERLQSAGYRTVGVMAHHYFKWKTGFDQGFDVWDTTTVPAQPKDSDPTITSEQLTDAAIRVLSDESGEKPFFAWVHYVDPHSPYMPHADAPDLGPLPPKSGGTNRDLYDQEIWFTDKHVGRLIDFVSRSEWASRTAIIVTADHGEAFGERGFLHHGRELWETLVRVPLIVYVPDAIPHRVTQKRSHIDIVPTVLELATISSSPSEDASPESALPGRSLLADVDADPDAGSEIEERDVFLDMPEGPFNEERRALITGPSPGLKLIDYGGDRYELYDLAADPLESKPLADASARREAISKLTQRRRGLGVKTAAP